MKEEYVTEEWRDIPNYEGIYQVSNLGRVKRLQREEMRPCIVRNGYKVKGFSISISELLLKPSDTRDGYKRVSLCKKGKQEYLRVHRLVASAFIPNPDNKPQVNHLDNNRSNNVVTNLEWCTAKENAEYASKQGRLIGRKGRPLSPEHKEKLMEGRRRFKRSPKQIAQWVHFLRTTPRTDEWKQKIGNANRNKGKKVIDARTNKTYPSIRICARELGVSESTIYRLIKKRVIKHEI